jgi:hypothetical protein
LRFRLAEIGEKDRVDVIVTNPPFGGEEEKGIQGNFPEDRQTAETALLFLQFIMRKLHRTPTSAERPARAAVVVPDGTLFGDGVCARIKEELLREFNLHTILVEGVQPPHNPATAKWSICALYRDSNKYLVLIDQERPRTFATMSTRYLTGEKTIRRPILFNSTSSQIV